MAVASLDPRSVQMEGITSSILQKALNESMQLDQGTEVALECLGSFAKGFMNDSCLDPGPVRSWYTEYCKGFLIGRMLKLNGVLTPVIVTSLIIFTQRMIPLMQGDSVHLVKAVSVSVLSDEALSDDFELVSSLLPLISAALFKLRDTFASPEVLGQLWPLLLSRVQRLLMLKPIQGTDDVIQHFSLCKSILSLFQALAASTPSALNLTLNRNTVHVEQVLIKILDIPGNSVDAIGLLRSLCGVVNKCQTNLSQEFLNCRLIPMLLHQSIRDVFDTLDPSSKKSSASLPASLINFLQDFLTMLRSLHQNGRLSPETAVISLRNGPAIDLVQEEVKEIRSILINHFLK